MLFLSREIATSLVQLEKNPLQIIKELYFLKL